MKTKRKSSIFVKTQIYLILFCVVILLFAWFIEIYFFKTYYSKYQIDITSKVAKVIINTDLDNIVNAEAVENLAYKNNLCISVYGAYGDVKNYNTKMVGCNLNHPKVMDLIYQFFDQEMNEKKYLIDISKKDRGFLYAVKNEQNDIYIYAPLIDNAGVSQLLRGQLIYITLLCIIISSAVAMFISRKITLPIQSITNKAKNIGKEKYDNIYKETGIKEIDELNETLNEVQVELGKVKNYQQDLLANVSHDLKTPLTMIKAYAEKIKDISYQDKEKLDKDVAIIVDEADRLTLLVNDILEISSLNAAENNLFIEEYDLIKEIKNILTKYDIIKEREGYTFNVDLLKSARIRADKKKINQVIYNLINNAINYTGDDKVVNIKINEDNKNYIVRIIDTGKGIKKKDIKNIWTKYYKNDKHHKRNVVSTGIGLSIVRETLEKHGFEYGVNSVVNHGSEFYFKIPKEK